MNVEFQTNKARPQLKQDGKWELTYKNILLMKLATMLGVAEDHNTVISTCKNCK
jgi:hypothetical protein